MTTAIITANPNSAPMIAPRRIALNGNPNPAPTIAQLAVYKHSIKPTSNGDLGPGGSYFAIGATTHRPAATIAVETIRSLVENRGIPSAYHGVTSGRTEAWRYHLGELNKRVYKRSY